MVEVPVPSPLRVLVVDDEDDLRRLIARRLVRAGGFEVVGEAADVAAAVDVAGAQQPDVILLDVMLGDERAHEAIGPLQDAAPEAMIAALTALPADVEEPALRRAGAFVFYEKTMLRRLHEYLPDDATLHRRALAGEQVHPPTATERR